MLNQEDTLDISIYIVHKRRLRYIELEDIDILQPDSYRSLGVSSNLHHSQPTYLKALEGEIDVEISRQSNEREVKEAVGMMLSQWLVLWWLMLVLWWLRF